MSDPFFPDSPPHPLPEDEEDAPPRFDAGWEGPPGHLRPGVADLSVVLGRSPSTVVALEGAWCYPSGVVLHLVVHVGDTRRGARQRVLEYLQLAHGRGSLDMAWRPGGLRWGLETSDGQRVTSLHESPWADERPVDSEPGEWSPDHPVLEPLGRSSGFGSGWSRDVWLWPLPPEGPVTFVCEWTDRGVDRTELQVDATRFRDAAAHAEPLWP